MHYYRLVKGRLCPAPDNIRSLLGSPTRSQYLFFGYKPLMSDTVFDVDGAVTYVEEDTVIRIIKSEEI